MVRQKQKEITRCPWCGDDPLYVAYHDREWGVPLHDDRGLFEMLILEGAQAGLSWLTVLKRREGYRRAFDNFDAEKIVAYKAKKINHLLQDTGIIRNRLKVEATIKNARAYLALREEFGGFNDFIWQFVDGEPQRNRWRSMEDIPAVTPAAEAMSKALKKRGFSFVGPTICYAYMQAVGMVNDHLTRCFRHAEV